MRLSIPCDVLFLSTPSARRATLIPYDAEKIQRISIHALREEGDLVIQPFGQTLEDFYPRPPRGGRRKNCISLVRAPIFLSTPSARRATHDHAEPESGMDISIHALREEGDGQRGPKTPDECISIHALREEGDAQHPDTAVSTKNISIHALREEGDTGLTIEQEAKVEISIHALREEGDLLRRLTIYVIPRFLSTPSARRATSGHSQKLRIRRYFYPRPPRGGRHGGADK